MSSEQVIKATVWIEGEVSMGRYYVPNADMDETWKRLREAGFLLHPMSADAAGNAELRAAEGHIRDCQGAGCGATVRVSMPCRGAARVTTPKYRTDAQACSCPGFWYRRTCRHYRAYRDAVSLVEAQDAVNVTWDADGPRMRVLWT